MTARSSQVRIALVRADSGFCTQGMMAELETRGLHYILTAALRSPVRTLCRHDDAAWTPTEVKGIEIQDITHDGARLVVLRQKTLERPYASGKQLLEVPGYKFQALRTNLPASVSALEVWRRYNGRADIENRIKELGSQFGLKGLWLILLRQIKDDNACNAVAALAARAPLHQIIPPSTA